MSESHTVVEQIDAQDPLPESNFFWRRLYSYIATFSIWGLLVYVIYKMEDAGSLRTVALYLSMLLWFTITYYMIAPSAEQITRIIQAARTLRSGVPMRRRTSVDTSHGDHAEVEMTAGYQETSESEDAAPRSRYHD